MVVTRSRFGQDLAQQRIQIAQNQPETTATLDQLGLTAEEIRGADQNQDGIITGQAEFEALYDALQAADAQRPRAQQSLGRAEQMYQQMRPQQSPAAAAQPEHLVETGEGVYVARPPELAERAAQLRALPPPTGRGRGHESIDAYLSAIEAREADQARPSDVPGHIWNMTAALERRGISSADVEHYLVTGMLPDQVNAQGEVTESGIDRWNALESAATDRGSWTAVNSMTFLVNMRRSSLNTQRQAMQTRLDAMQPNDPQAAQLETAIEEAETFEDALRRGLSSVYSSATHARERRASATVARAESVATQAAAARESGDVERATQLESQAQELRDRGARWAHSEATYRAQFQGTGWDAARTYDLAAQAQLGTGQAQIQAQVRSGNLSETPPAALGSAEDAGNGVPGATNLLDRSAELGGPTQRNLALRGQTSASLAVFHRAHLDRANYFATPGADGSVPARSEATIGHRESYLQARASQAEVARQRLALYGPPNELSGEEAAEAAGVAAERRAVLDEFSAVLGQEAVSQRGDRSAQEAATRAHSSLRELRTAETNAWEGVTVAEEGIDAAVTQDRALLGDTLKTEGQARRDDQGISDAHVIAHSERQQAELLTAQRMSYERRVTTADARATQMSTRAARDRQDADLVRSTLTDNPLLAPGARHSARSRRSYLAVRHEANGLALRQEDYVDRVLEDPETRDLRLVQGHQLDLARYWTTSTIMDGEAYGRRAGAMERLNRADGLLDRVDQARFQVPAGSDHRAQLASGVVAERSRLATGYASYDNGAARDQLQSAEQTATRDLRNRPEQLRAARAQIGTAAIGSIARHDQRFDEVLEAGRYDAEANDTMYRQAHDMLDREDVDGQPGVESARAQLRQLDSSIAAMDRMFSTSRTQVERGFRYAEARTRELGRAEIQGATAQVSGVISGGVWLVTLGHVDMKDEMAEAGEHATNMRISSGVNQAASFMHGATQLQGAWESARDEGRPLQFIGAMRVFSDRSRGQDERTQQAYGEAFQFLHTRAAADGSRAENDWQTTNRVGVRDGEVPVLASLNGSVFGIAPTMELAGDTDTGVVTDNMRDMIDSQRESYEEATEDMGLIIGINTTLEFVGGLVLTAGIGSAAAVGNTANTLNGARGALTAMNGVRNMATVGRAAQALRAVGTAGAWGVGIYAGGQVVGEVAGRSSSAYSGYQTGAGIFPGLVAQRVSGFTAAARRMAAAEGAAGRLAGTTQGLSRASLASHARFYGPQAALGGVQIVGTQLATPVIAEQLGLRGEHGQAMVGVALGAMFAGGMAVGVQAMNRRAQNPAAQGAGRLLAGEGNARVSRQVSRDVDTFLRQTDGRVATAAEAAQLRSSLLRRMGVPEQGGGEVAVTRRMQVDATIDALQIRQASSVGLARATGDRGGEVNAQSAHRAVELAARELVTVRQANGQPASRAQAYQDAAAGVIRSLGDGAPDLRARVQLAAMDRAQSAEIVGGLVAQRQGGSPVIPQSQALRAERVLASELGNMRAALADGRSLTSGQPSPMARAGQRLRDAGLSPTAAESVLRGAQRHLVESGTQIRLAQMQSTRATPMTEAEVRTAAQSFAEQAGVPREHAQALAGEMVSRAGFVNWVQSQRAQHHWSPEVAQENFVDALDQTRSTPTPLRNLTAQELRAIYPEGGAIPHSLGAFQDVNGFEAFARANPRDARVLADAYALFGSSRVNQALRQHGLAGAATRLRSELPAVQQHPTRADYLVVQRGTSSPSSVPAVNLRPAPSLDHNGAFHQRANVPGRAHAIPGASNNRWIGSVAPDHVVMRPDQLHSANGPLTSMDHVLVFSGHGGRRGFSGVRTPEAAALVADQIVAAQSRGTRIDHVVLDACHQRDARMFIGRSNGQAFQAELNAALQARGVTRPVEVLAASRGGPTYGAQQRNSYWGRGAGFSDATYTPANSSVAYMSKADWIAAGIVLGAGAEATALGIIYHSMQSDRASPPVEPPADPDPVDAGGTPPADPVDGPGDAEVRQPPPRP